MTSATRLRTPVRVALSASQSPDIAAFGLSSGHMRDAVADLVLQLLAADMDIAYGGNLCKDGLTHLLSELAIRYARSEDPEERPRVASHLPWPVHIGMPIGQLERTAKELRGIAELVLVGKDGRPMTLQSRRALPSRTPSPAEWVEGLTAMRRLEQSCTDARVVLGGQVDGYRGRMPGVAEEALLSLRGRQPLFLVGGFGGAARDVAETLDLAEPWAGSRGSWRGKSDFAEWTGDDLNNGLSREENGTLATTPFIRQVVVLVLRGLFRVKAERVGDSEGTAAPAT